MDEPKDQAAIAFGDVARPKLADYAKKYAHILSLERSDGVLVARLQSNGGVFGTTGWFNVWSQAWLEIGNDPENEVIIITATGDRWIEYPVPIEEPITDEMQQAMASSVNEEQMYRLYADALKNSENVIFGLNVPTIGIIQAPAYVHYEMALFCDITLCADDSFFKDPHADFGLGPGDGLGLAFQFLLPPKHQAYFLYTSDTMDAETAFRLGLVNEVLPKDQLMPRAQEIARRILRMPKLGRLMTKQIVRRQLQQRHVQDAGFHLAHELLGYASNVAAGSSHTLEQVRDSLAEFENAARNDRS